VQAVPFKGSPVQGQNAGKASVPDGNKWNPHTNEGRIQLALFGSEADPVPYFPTPTPIEATIAKAGLGFVPGLNSALVFDDPKSTTFDKAFAVTTDVLSVVGVGTVLKLGAKGAGLAKGLVVGVEVAEGAAHVEGAASKIIYASKSLLQKGLMKAGHAEALGVVSACTKDGCARFSRALNMFVNDAAVVEFAGKYHGAPALHFYNPVTGVNVVVSHAGEYVTVFRPGETQLTDLLLKGELW
jgi:hypothetical protein